MWRASKRNGRVDARLAIQENFPGSRPTRANKPMATFSARTRIAIAPEANSSLLTRRKSTCFDSPANNVGPWPASLGCTTNRIHRSIPGPPTPAGASDLQRAVPYPTPA